MTNGIAEVAFAKARTRSSYRHLTVCAGTELLKRSLDVGNDAMSRFNSFTFKLFTLLELLIVISVIAILMAILLPALKTAKGMGKQAMCANNQRQIGVAFYAYFGDYNEYFPPISNPDFSMPRWSNYLSSDNKYGPNFNGYVSFKTFTCPEVGRINDTYSNEEILSWGNPQFAVSSTLLQTGSRLSQVRNPANTLLLVDNRKIYLFPSDNDTWFMICYLCTTQSYFAIPYGRHNRGANVLWVDGHVSAHKIPVSVNPYGGKPFSDANIYLP